MIVRIWMIAFTAVCLTLVGCQTVATTPSPPSTTAAPIENTPSNDNDTVRLPDRLVFATGEWPPFTSRSMEGGGLATELVTAVGAEMGTEIVYEWHTWPQAYERAKGEDVWGAFPYTYNNERGAEMYVSDQLLPDFDSVFFYYKTPPVTKVTDASDLRGLKLGGVNGYFYEAHFEAVNLDYELVSTDRENIAKLINGEIDLYPAVEIVGRHYIQTHFPEEVDNFGTLYFPWPVAENEVPGLRVIVSRNNPDHIDQLRAFNEALATIRENGTHARIMAKYGIGE